MFLIDNKYTKNTYIFIINEFKQNLIEKRKLPQLCVVVEENIKIIATKYVKINRINKKQREQ